MKKVIKIVMIVVLSIAVLVGVGAVTMGQEIHKTYKRLDDVATTDLAEVEDGIYEGIEETALVKATVLVTVKEHQITEIELTRHVNGRGASAEAMIPEMVRLNTSEVDGVTGATLSSKTIRAAVRNALAKGAKGIS